MYLNFFGLNKDPFRITPDPEFFFSGGNRGAVLEALCYAIAKGEGIVKVVGEVGSGKTMLCRMLERELPDNCEIIYLANPRLNADDVLYAIAHELQLNVAGTDSKLEALGALQKYLLEKHANNRRVVMFIEEAQGMLNDTLEEIRMLSNLETTQEKLLQIVLFGQPELEQKLAAHEIRQLKERITYSFNLTPLNREEIRDYLYTRLRASNYRGNELFTKGAISALAKRSQGLLRRINVLADKALLAAFAQGAHKVERKHVKMAINDSDFSAPPLKLLPVLASTLFVFTLAAMWWWWEQPGEQPLKMLGISEKAETTTLATHRFDAQQLGAAQVVSPATAHALSKPLQANADTTSGVASGLAEKPIKKVANSSERPEKALLVNAVQDSTPPQKKAENKAMAQSVSPADEFQMFEALKFDTSVVSLP